MTVTASTVRDWTVTAYRYSHFLDVMCASQCGVLHQVVSTRHSCARGHNATLQFGLVLRPTFSTRTFSPVARTSYLYGDVICAFDEEVNFRVSLLSYRRGFRREPSTGHLIVQFAARAGKHSLLPAPELPLRAPRRI